MSFFRDVATIGKDLVVGQILGIQQQVRTAYEQVQDARAARKFYKAVKREWAKDTRKEAEDELAG